MVILHMILLSEIICIITTLESHPSSDPPSINGSEVPVEVSVVVNHVLELECEAWGIPAPSLTWLKDGRPLPHSMRLLRGGEVLRVASAQVSGLGLRLLAWHFLKI